MYFENGTGQRNARPSPLASLCRNVEKRLRPAHVHADHVPVQPPLCRITSYIKSICSLSFGVKALSPNMVKATSFKALRPFSQAHSSVRYISIPIARHDFLSK